MRGWQTSDPAAVSFFLPIGTDSTVHCGDPDICAFNVDFTVYFSADQLQKDEAAKKAREQESSSALESQTADGRRRR